MEFARADDEERESYRILNDEIDARHASLVGETRATETKATVVAGFAAASVSFLLDHRQGLRPAACMPGCRCRCHTPRPRLSEAEVKELGKRIVVTSTLVY